MKTAKEEIDYIFSIGYQPNCHPSRTDDVKAEEAIRILAVRIDEILFTLQELKSKVRRNPK